MNNIQDLQEKNNALSNYNSTKFEYIKGIANLKANEPKADGVDYYEDYETLEANESNEMVTVTKQRFVEVPKPHKEWEEKLANYEAGLVATKSSITSLRSEVDELEEALLV
jgi:hypothetical protein